MKGIAVMVVCCAALLCTTAALAQGREKNVVPQGEAIYIGNIFVCKALDDAKAVTDVIAEKNPKRFTTTVIPLQVQGRCRMSEGAVVYQATVYERDDTNFRVLSLIPLGSTTTYYEVTDWAISDNTI